MAIGVGYHAIQSSACPKYFLYGEEQIVEMRCTHCGGSLKYGEMASIADMEDRFMQADKILHCEHCGSSFLPDEISPIIETGERSAVDVNQKIVTIDGDFTGLAISGEIPDMDYKVNQRIHEIAHDGSVVGVSIDFSKKTPTIQPVPSSQKISILERITTWFSSVFKRR